MHDPDFVGDYASGKTLVTAKELILDVSPTGHWFLLDPSRLQDDFDGDWEISDQHIVIQPGHKVVIQDATLDTTGNIHWVRVYAIFEGQELDPFLLTRVSDRRPMVSNGQTDTTRWRFTGPNTDCLVFE